MANPEHLKILKQGVEVWNKWREENFEVRPDLSDTNLIDEFLLDANLSYTNLSSSSLAYANLQNANLIDSNLHSVDLQEANLIGANLSRADLQNSHLAYSLLSNANLSFANLKDAWIMGAILIETNFNNAIIQRARIYGISAWNLKKDGLIQKDLIITPPGEPEITVDDLEVAQFIYLMLNNQKIRDVIETITSKAVLILGCFTPKRKAVLDALKDELRQRNYLPIVFDFENAGNRSLTETVSLLAKMSKFVIADITDAKGIIHEIREIVPMNSSLPIRPLILKSKKDEEYVFFKDFKHHNWLLPLYEYESPEALLQEIVPAVIDPAEQKVAELRNR